MPTIEGTARTLLGLAGLDINRTRNHLTLRALLRDFFVRNQVDCVFDVGANIGTYGLNLRAEFGFKGLILSFEPVAAVHDQLQQRASKDSRWITRRAALGARNGTLKIHVAKDNRFSSFLTPDHKTVDEYIGQNLVEAEEEVPILTLDSIFEELRAEHGFRRPFLKMDTQGFDREVLNGAVQYLPGFVGLQSEVSLLPIYQDIPGIGEMHSLIARMGFDLCGIYPVIRDRLGRWVEADSIYIRRPDAKPQSFIQNGTTPPKINT